MKITFLIRSLEGGGAERQLLFTAKGLAPQGHNVSVVTFYDVCFYAAELDNSVVRLIPLHKQGRWDLLSFYWRLIKQLRQEAPEALYSFLDSANVFSILCKPFLPHTKIIWGVRASNVDFANYPWISRWSYKAECFLSRFADRIIANSRAGLDYAAAHGFPREKMSVVHNGIDTEYFAPDHSLGLPLRTQWGVANDQLLIGLVGRIDPMKGHEVFLQAAAILKENFTDMRFVCVGDGEKAYVERMRAVAKDLKLEDVLTWAGVQSDMPAVYNALDLLVSSSSFGEGFSNVIAEAMACGVPCVVTDVGDSADIVGDCGELVPPNQPQLLADAITRQIENPPDKLACRDRVVSLYSLSTYIDQTEAALKALIR